MSGVLLFLTLSCAKTAPEVPMAQATDVFEVACAIAENADVPAAQAEVASRGWRWLGHGDSHVSLGAPSPVSGAALDALFGPRRRVPGVDGVGLGSWSRWTLPDSDCTLRARMGDADRTERFTVELPER